MTAPDPDRLEEQKAYYRARADEYDEWFERRGRYDHGALWNTGWQAEIEEVRQALVAFRPTGRVLELAAGTGWWTAELMRHANEVTAVDASAETLALNRQRVREVAVRHVQADIFNWQPDGLYDVVFFSFWLSHVPPERFDAFWSLVRSALVPGGRVFFIDSRRVETGGSVVNPEAAAYSIIARRRLKDGREFEIYKVFYDPAALAEQLRALGWHATIATTENHFLYGQASPATR